ncbi:hypothetical protein [Streptomyces sp. NPDC093149]|uniref:hypothetical protein n=1 Tax=Streptomyces sp. NPDC093149 TaxID=3366031 RepID=UPI0038002C0E
MTHRQARTTDGSPVLIELDFRLVRHREPPRRRPPAPQVLSMEGQGSVVLAVAPEPQVWARYSKSAVVGGS